MPAYVIVDVIITDQALYETYKPLAFASVTASGGKFIARGGKSENLEGDWQPERIVILEFPDFDTAKSWWNSEQYALPKSIRQAASISRMIVVEGV